MQFNHSALGYIFKNHSLLEEALTHPSYKRINNQRYDYNRLEFLGDTVLSLIMADILFTQYPNLAEGELSILHAKLVSCESLAKIALENSLGDMMLMDNGEEKNRGRKNQNNLEDVLEAIIAAIFLDSSYLEVKQIVKQVFASAIDQASTEKNHKSALQEWLQQNKGQNPVYTLIEQTGKAHSPNFTVEVLVNDDLKFSATARTKKRAEFLAAHKALTHIKNLEKQHDK